MNTKGNLTLSSIGRLWFGRLPDFLACREPLFSSL